MVTPNKNLFYRLADAGIDVPSFQRLLKYFDVPVSFLGLSDAIPNMHAAGESLHKLIPESKSVADFHQFLYSLDQQKSLFEKSSDKIDRNCMRGHYDDYPVFSVFTQNKSAREPAPASTKFLLISGLLLVSIWLGDEPWNPVPRGFKTFLGDLRLLRKEKRFDELSFIPERCTSLQDLIETITTSSAGSVVAKKTRKLALEVQQRLSVADSYTDKSYDEAAKTKSESNRQARDFGNADEWKVRGKRIRRGVATERPNVVTPRKVVLLKPSTSQPGVDTAESELSASLAEAPVARNADELPEINSQAFHGLEARYATEFDNQFLPYSWEVLNEHEVFTLVSTVVSALQSDDDEKRLGALIAGLSIITSRSPAELAVFLIIDGEQQEILPMPAFLMDRSCWYSPFPSFDRFNPTVVQSAWLKKTGEGCFLPLPVELLIVLIELVKEGKTLGSALNRTADDLEKLARDFCRSVRQDARSRTNVSWLRGIMFQRMYAFSRDEVGTIATLGSTEHAQSIGLYYASFEQGEWQEKYSQAISSIGLTPTTCEGDSFLPFGSRQLPDPDKLMEWIQDLGKKVDMQCRNAKGRVEIIAAHNLMSCYTFLMALAGSGHRPSSTYTFSPSSYDLNNGWALISDKITSPATRIRLIPLPEMVIRQFTNYETHLRNLAVRLSDAAAGLSAKIDLLVRSPRRTLVPFFFILDDSLNAAAIDIASVVQITGFPYEGNAFRHFLSTGLRDEGCTAEHIAILLAHVENGQYGFGKFSALSPAQWKEAIVNSLGAVLRKQGWIPVSGINHLRKPLPHFEKYRKKLSDESEFDVFGKASDHLDSTEIDRKVVREAYAAAKAKTLRESSGDEFLEVFRTEIICRSVGAPERLGKRLNYLVRFVRLHRHTLKPSSIPGLATDLDVEDAVFKPDTLSAAASAAWYREKLAYLAEDFESLSHTKQVALILVSSILMGALLRDSLVKELPSILNSARAFKGLLWIDFDDSISGSVQRWFADPASALLIARYNSGSGNVQAVRSHHLSAAVTDLLKRNNPDSEVTELRSLEDLIHAAKAYFTLSLPGLLRAFAFGDVNSASLFEGAWLRLLTGRRLAMALNHESRPKEASIRPHISGSENQVLAKKIYKEILDAISKEFPASASGAKNRKGERKNRLAAVSRNLNQLASEHEDMPSVLFAIFAWADRQAIEGTVARRNPSVGTIYSYVTDIARPLVEFASDCDFLELSEAELTDLYQRVIDYGSERNSSSRAQSLRWFHEFCEEEFDVQELDWDEIFPGKTTGNSRVSANLLTFVEYIHAKRLLVQHPALGKRDRQMHVVALILLYRTGIRLGELMRLTVSDLVLNIRNILLVRNGIYGKTKTRAGIRQIPWLDRLDEEELSLVEDWLDHRKTVAGDDPWSVLFGEEDEARMLEVRHHLSRNITQALRQVSGDPGIKIHHMRHGAGTSAISLALSSVSSGFLVNNGSDWFSIKDKTRSATEFHEFHLGDATPTRRIIWAISQGLGHASPRTTVWHYGHSLDLALHEHVSQKTSLKSADISRLSGMSQNLLNVTAHKRKGESTYSIALSWLSRNLNQEDLEYRVEDQPFSEGTAVSSPPIRLVTSTKLVHLILTDILNGFGAARVANRYVREEMEVQAIADAAKQIERKTGYRGYKRKYSTVLSKKGDSLSRLMSGRAIDFIPKFKEAFENPKKFPKLQRGIEAWTNNYEANQSGIRIPYEDDLDAFIEMLSVLGIDKEQIILASNSPSEFSKWSGTMKINVVSRADSYRSSKRTPSGTKKAPTLLVTHAQNGDVNNPKAGQSISMIKLNHQFFLSAVLLSARQNFRLSDSVKT